MLDRLIRGQSPRPQFTANSAAFGAPPGGLDEYRLNRVDPDVANVQGIGDAFCPNQVGADDGGDKAEAAVVGQRQRLCLRSKATGT
ncbi:hypothetical protein D3C81_1415900 [compost metagenome]